MRIVPRPFSQVLNDSIVSWTKLWRPLLLTGLMVFIPATLLMVWVFSETNVNEILAAILADPGYLNSLTDQELQDLASPLFTALAAVIAIQAVATTYLFLVAHNLVVPSLSGEPTEGGRARLDALRRLPRALLIMLISAVAIMGSLFVGLTIWDAFGGIGFAGMVLFLVAMIPAIWLAIALSLQTTITALEQIGLVATLRRSATLVTGRWGATLGFLILVGALGSMASFLIQWITPLAVTGNSDVLVTILGLVGVGIQGLIMAGLGVAITHWYLDLRARREGDLQL